MAKKSVFFLLIPGYIIVFFVIFAITFGGDRTITTLSETVYKDTRPQVVIDAGHGGIDGGATSCTGILESKLNLEIAVRVSDLIQLLGLKSIMICCLNVIIFAADFYHTIF